MSLASILLGVVKVAKLIDKAAELERVKSEREKADELEKKKNMSPTKNLATNQPLTRSITKKESTHNPISELTIYLTNKKVFFYSDFFYYNDYRIGLFTLVDVHYSDVKIHVCYKKTGGGEGNISIPISEIKEESRNDLFFLIEHLNTRKVA